MVISKEMQVSGFGAVVQSNGDLYTNVQDLGKLISVRDDAYARMNSQGRIGKSEGTRVSMVVYYFKGEKPILIRNGMTRTLAKRLVQANSQNKYFSTGSAEAYEKARELAERQEKSGIEPEKRKAILCPSRTVFGMSPAVNPNHHIFAFQDLNAREGESSYWQFAKNAVNAGEDFVINFYPIDADVVDGKNPDVLTALNGTIENYVWFRSLDGRSELIGDDRVAGYYYYRARGVRLASTEGAKPAKENARVMSYSQRDVARELKRLSRLESEIQKSRNFLDSLRTQ